MKPCRGSGGHPCLQLQAGSQRKAAGPGSQKRAIIPETQREAGSPGRKPGQRRAPRQQRTWRAQGTVGPLNLKGCCVRDSRWSLASRDTENTRECFHQGSAAQNLAQRKWKPFSLGSPFPTTGSFRKACQLLRSRFLFLLLGLSLSFSYHDASNRACIFLSSHLSVLAREGKVGQGLRGALLGWLCSQRPVCVCECAHTCMNPGKLGAGRRQGCDKGIVIMTIF